MRWSKLNYMIDLKVIMNKSNFCFLLAIPRFQFECKPLYELYKLSQKIILLFKMEFKHNY